MKSILLFIRFQIWPPQLVPGPKRRSHRMSGGPSAYFTAYFASYVLIGVVKEVLLFIGFQIWPSQLAPGSKRYPKSGSAGPSAYFTASFAKYMLPGMVKDFLFPSMHPVPGLKVWETQGVIFIFILTSKTTFTMISRLEVGGGSDLKRSG